MPPTVRVGINDPMTFIDKIRLDFFLKLFIALNGPLVGLKTIMVSCFFLYTTEKVQIIKHLFVYSLYSIVYTVALYFVGSCICK